MKDDFPPEGDLHFWHYVNSRIDFWELEAEVNAYYQVGFVAGEYSILRVLKPFLRVRDFNEVEGWLREGSILEYHLTNAVKRIEPPDIQAIADALNSLYQNITPQTSYNGEKLIEEKFLAAKNTAYNNGDAEGRYKIFRLCRELYNADRAGDIIKMCTDKSLIEKFYKEFNII